MTPELLVNLCGVPNVLGAALYTEEGVCIESRLHAPYDDGFVHDVLKDLLAGSEAYSFLDTAPISMVIARARSGLLAFMSRNRMRVLAVTNRDVNPAFLHVAFGSLGKRLDAVDADLVQAMSPSLFTGSVSGSNLTIDASQIERIPRADAVSIDEMKSILTSFVEFAGPAAKMVLKQELRALGYGSSSLPRNELGALVERLASRLSSDSQRERFRRSLGRP